MPTNADAVRLRSYWRRVPDRRTVTYYRRTAVVPVATYSEFDAFDLWHRDFGTMPHPGNPGVYVVYTADLFLPKETNTAIATTAPPVPGDRVQDAAATRIPRTGRLWTVNSVHEVGSEGAWKLGCVAPVILNGLGVTLKVQRPAIAQTDSGLRLSQTWTDVSSVTGWFQQVNTAATDTLGKRQIPDRATVYLETLGEIPEAQDTVYDAGNEARYTILAVRPALDLMSLAEMDIERLF
jgi:hypothetical protein